MVSKPTINFVTPALTRLSVPAVPHLKLCHQSLNMIRGDELLRRGRHIPNPGARSGRGGNTDTNWCRAIPVLCRVAHSLTFVLRRSVLDDMTVWAGRGFLSRHALCPGNLNLGKFKHVRIVHRHT